MFRNPSHQPEDLAFNFAFPAQAAIYDDLQIAVNGHNVPFSTGAQGIAVTIPAQPNESFEVAVSYTSHGLESWRYSFGKDVQQTNDLDLTVTTNFEDVDFPPNALSPTRKTRTGSGWSLNWRYANLISGINAGVDMPEHLQPGPLAGEISRFAPVSLFLFFFVLITLTAVRGIELHPMNYFFLAAAFFAFHLLLAYSVDHISIQLAFVLSSLVSVGLVVSYLRLVVGARFAMVEAGMAQILYLVPFSFSFFLKGFTGLSITIGCILTLLVAMQTTARVNWRRVFASETELAHE